MKNEVEIALKDNINSIVKEAISENLKVEVKIDNVSCHYFNDGQTFRIEVEISYNDEVVSTSSDTLYVETK